MGLKIWGSLAKYTIIEDGGGYYNGRTVEDALQENGYLHSVNGSNGFPTRSLSTIAFVEGTRTFTITGTDFPVVHSNVIYTKNTESIIISDVTGLHAIVYDGGVLSDKMGESAAHIILTYDLIAFVYWDAVNNKAVYYADERHGTNMSSSTHALLHVTDGARYGGGMSLADMSVDQTGNLDADAQCSINSGDLYDEDLHHSLATQTHPATIPVIFVNGTTWEITTPIAFPVKSYPAGRLAFNEDVAGTWQQTEVTDGNFVLAHIFATNDDRYPYIAIQGQAEYGNKNDAQDGAQDELINLFTAGLPMEEGLAIATIIYQTKNTYTNTVKAKTVSTAEAADYVDWREQTVKAGGAITASSDLILDTSPQLGGDLDVNDFNINALTGKVIVLSNNLTEIAQVNATGITLADLMEVKLGTSSDLRIYFGGTNSYIVNKTGKFYIQQTAAADFQIYALHEGIQVWVTTNGKFFEIIHAGSWHYRFDENGALFSANLTIQDDHNIIQTGSGTFSTGTGGVAINGDLTMASGKDINLSENFYIHDRDGDVDSVVRIMYDKNDFDGLQLYAQKDGALVSKALYLHDGTTYRPALFDNYPDAITLGGNLTMASGKVISSADEDLTFTFGRAAIGSPAVDIAYFGHRDVLTTANYALRQDAVGGTVINAASGQSIILKISNSTHATLNSAGLTMGSGRTIITDTAKIGALSHSTNYIIGDEWVVLRSGLTKDMFLECGGDFLWRDVDASNTVRMTLDSATGNLSLTGNLTMASGKIITLAQDPVANLEATTKQYVDGLVASGTNYQLPVEFYQSAQPTVRHDSSALQVGDLFIDTDDDKVYAVVSTGPVVWDAGTTATTGDAHYCFNDGNTYRWDGASWIIIASTVMASHTHSSSATGGNVLNPLTITISGAGTLTTGTGAIALNGNITVASSKVITMDVGYVPASDFQVATKKYVDDATPSGYALETEVVKKTASKVAAQFDTGAVAPSSTNRLNYDGYFYATRVYGAVYNDFADFWHLKPNEPLKFGYVYVSEGKDSVICRKRGDKATIGIASDTYGSSVGSGKLPIAVAGFTLAHVDKLYKAGTCLISDKHGILTKARFWERFKAIAKYLYKEPSLKWKDVEVNNRCWVKIL